MLLIDIGNTQIKWNYIDQGDLVTRAVYDGMKMDILIDKVVSSSVTLSKVVLCASVADEAFTYSFLIRLKSATGSKVYLVSTLNGFNGFNTNYQQPQSLGVDRWLAMLGVLAMAKDRSFILADIGSALTVDYVDKSVHQGGFIFPGIVYYLDSMTHFKNLPQVDSVSAAELKPATSTQQGIINGVLMMFVSLLNQQSHIASQQNLSLYLTGGDSKWLANHLIAEWHVEADLVIKGLQELAKEKKIFSRFERI